ncbi:MAG: amidohydrolase family protein [Rhodospirillales bacterium]|nr:MAG: amidohydrolase family protein [Rhodospirillales bacterium]
MRRRGFMAAVTAVAAPAPFARAQEPMPIFDAHIHYSHDAWDVVPPKEAIAILKRAGVRRAMVSSSNDDGTQMLHAEAPDMIVPELRPYRRRGELSTWVREEAVIREMETRLKKYRYVAIGEFHLYGADAELPVPRRMVELARQYKLFLHAHSDIDAVERLLKLDPGARVLWAHSGFAGPEEVRAMLRKHRNLWCDLAFRGDHASGDKVEPAWREAFLEFPDRFLVGTDTFTPERWHYIPEHANFSRAWLSDLPKEVAERIGWRNGEEVFGRMMGAAR